MFEVLYKKYFHDESKRCIRSSKYLHKMTLECDEYVRSYFSIYTGGMAKTSLIRKAADVTLNKLETGCLSNECK